MCPNIVIAGKNVHLYNLLNNLGAVCFALFSFFQIRRLKDINVLYAMRERLFSPKEKAERSGAILLALQICVLIVCFLLVMLKLNHAFGNWFTAGNANYYGIITAWILTAFVCSVLCFTSPLKAFDLFSPGLPLFLFICKLACFADGCCSGFAADTFFFNQDTNRREFPVQLVEAGVALILFMLLLVYRKHNRRFGTIFPLYLTSYSASRFLTEFLRDDFPNVLGPFDAYQIMSVIFFLIGLMALIITWKKGEDIDSFCEVRYQRILKNISERIKKRNKTPKQTVSQKRYSKQWQSTKKKYKKKK